MINQFSLARGGMIAGILALLMAPVASQADVYDITVDNVIIDTGDFKKTGIGYNGASPGPALRFSRSA